MRGLGTWYMCFVPCDTAAGVVMFTEAIGPDSL